MMTRRGLIALLASTAAVSWPGGVRAQQRERARHIGVISILAEADPESRVRRAAFEQSLQALGWINGSNLRIDYRWAANDAKRVHEYARELAALRPDVILTSGTVVIAPTIEEPAALSQLFLCRPLTLLERASSKAWRGQAATSPASSNTSIVLPENGLSCSRRLHSMLAALP